MTHWMFRCSDISKKVSMSLDEKLPLHERAAVRFHLMMCRYCARFRHQMIQLREMSRADHPGRPAGDAEPGLSREAKARIKERLSALS